MESNRASVFRSPHIVTARKRRAPSNRSLPGQKFAQRHAKALPSTPGFQLTVQYRKHILLLAISLEIADFGQKAPQCQKWRFLTV